MLGEEAFMPAPKGNKNAVGNKGGGRKSSYQKQFAKVAQKMCELGATDREIAEALGIAEPTLHGWRAKHVEFSEALKAGKTPADDRVERSLYHKAVGYTFASEKVFQFQGEIVRAKTVEHVPPSDTAAIFWLKNRRKDEWRDRTDHEHSGKDGKPIELADVSDTESARRVAYMLGLAMARKKNAPVPAS
ncbi:MAG TPA: hypothetical protein VKA31_00325 [Mariprofundaceae bacterium]|nr:hypothetical protein [Mariprofundaceae bacterium]